MTEDERAALKRLEIRSLQFANLLHLLSSGAEASGEDGMAADAFECCTIIAVGIAESLSSLQKVRP